MMDSIIQEIVGIYEAAFPDRIRGYYLVGSFGDDTAISSSDIDMEIIFKGMMTDDERDRCQLVKASCRAIAAVHLDLPVKAEADFKRVDTVALKFRSKFVYGEDTRGSIPLPSIERYLRQISIPTQRGLTVRFRQEVVRLPLDYPIADDDYFGYVVDRVHDDPALKLWALNVGWLATFLIVHQAQVYVPSKRDMLPLYHEHINDEWTSFIAEVYEYGRNQWQYHLPDAENNVTRFKALCKQTLAFENHVATIYLDWLHDERVSGDREMVEARLAAFVR